MLLADRQWPDTSRLAAAPKSGLRTTPKVEEVSQMNPTKESALNKATS